MSRAARACKKLPSWALRRILDSTSTGTWWLAARFELWKREVEDEILMVTCDETGPWPTYLPPGIH